MWIMAWRIQWEHTAEHDWTRKYTGEPPCDLYSTAQELGGGGKRTDEVGGREVLGGKDVHKAVECFCCHRTASHVKCCV